MSSVKNQVLIRNLAMSGVYTLPRWDNIRQSAPRAVVYRLIDCRDSVVFYLVKIVVTTVLIVAISEISRRNSLVAAILASIPLVSVLAMVWLYIDTKSVAQVSSLASNVFWLVLPSTALFLSLPLLLRAGVNFYLALGIAIGITVACYFMMVLALAHFGVKL